MPVKMSGSGYAELVSHERGSEHFAAWVAIVEIAATQSPRGSLPKAVGRNPHDVGGICQSLSRISHLPIRIFEESVPRLLNDLQWIENTDSSEVSGKSTNALAENPNESAESAERREGDYREGKGREFPSLEGFDLNEWSDSLIAAHPNKKQTGIVAPRLSEISEVINPAWRAEFERVHKIWCRTELWNWKEGAKCPTLAEWIVDRGWKYLPPVSASPKSNGSMSNPGLAI